MSEINTKIQCPNCEIKRKKVVYCAQKPNGSYLCGACGSSYDSNESAKQIREDLLKAIPKPQ